MRSMFGPAGELSKWREALQTVNDNPLFYWLDFGRRRRQLAISGIRRALPLLIGATLTIIFLVFAIIEARASMTNDLLMIIKISVLIFVFTSYLIWASSGLTEAVMDMLSVLGNYRSGSFRLQLDDLTAITGLSDIEVTVGTARLVMPPLYLRIIAGAGLMWLIYLLVQTSMLEEFTNESTVMLLTAPLPIITWALFGCLGATALLLYFLAMGYGHWTYISSIAAASTLISQAVWLAVGTGVSVSMLMGGPGTPYGSTESSLLVLSMVVGPLLFTWLVYLSLEFCRRRPAFRLLYGAIGPLTNPLLAIICGMIAVTLLLLNDLDWLLEDELMMLVMGFIWQFGNMLPINPSAVAMPLLLTGDLHMLLDGLLWVSLPPLMVLLSQLALVILCAHYARLAVRDRRQSRT